MNYMNLFSCTYVVKYEVLCRYSHFYHFAKEAIKTKVGISKRRKRNAERKRRYFYTDKILRKNGKNFEKYDFASLTTIGQLCQIDS